MLIVEEKDRTLRLFGSRDNVFALVKMLDFVFGKKKSCYFDLFINNRFVGIRFDLKLLVIVCSGYSKNSFFSASLNLEFKIIITSCALN